MVQSRIIKEKEKFNLDLLEWEHKYEILEESYQQKVTEITALEYLKREFDGKTGKQILKELKELEKEKERIYNQLLESLGPEGKARLEALEKEAIVWMEKKREYLELIEQYRTKEHQFNLSEGELLRLREEKEQLDSQLKLAKAYKDELEAQIDQYIQKAQVKAVFENCSTMDVSDDLQRSRPNPDACPKLDKLVDDLQARLYYQKNERTKEPMCLYYSKDTLRLFLAGLAMSKLSLLQGLSGTGKTSLAREFVRAIGGGYTVVEVQSGWRDRQDLLGYYNTFEKKYYETDFLTGVYEALTPQYKNAPYFIILDEMNLSHPEHYFADFLSLIGNDAIEKNISFKQTPKGIIKDGKSGLPAKFEAKDKGLELPLGDNVWFIGTANHDETTLNFAPKTYDRSNVMEIVMERKPEDESLVKLGGNKFISFELMMEQFKKVEKEKEYKDGVIEVKKKLTGFSEFLKELEIGIGNRIMTQIDRFVPVYCAAGGTKEQALDHLLSSRVLREIKGSYTIDPDSLELFLEEINENEYPKSHQLISKELKRLKQS